MRVFVGVLIDTGSGWAYPIDDIGYYPDSAIPLWERALCCSITELHKMRGEEAAPLIADAVATMRACQDTYAGLLPDDTYATVEGAIRFLENIGMLANAHPLAHLELRLTDEY